MLLNSKLIETRDFNDNIIKMDSLAYKLRL